AEDRAGWGRVRRFKPGPAPIGAGTGSVCEGPVAPGQRFGYPTVPEEITEAVDDSPVSMPTPGATLWGVDVSRAMAQSWQGDLGFEPIRARTSKRSWLAPVNLTEEFVLGDKAVVGASDGSNGKTAKVTVTGKVPDGAKVDVDGYDVVAVAPDGRRKVIGKVEVGYTPTIGECRQIELETDPVRGGLPYEPDGRETRVLTLPAHYQIRALRRCEVAEITVDSLKLDGGGSRLVPIDSVCV